MLVYIAEQDAAQQDRLARYLTLGDHTVDAFSSISELDAAMTRAVPNSLVLDLSFPDKTSFSCIRSVKERFRLPVLVTGEGVSESDLVLSFELGCDDYLAKPYSLKELSLRLDALSRRYCPMYSSSSFVLGSSLLTLDWHGLRATLDGEEIHFSSAQWKILAYFAGNPDHLVSRHTLLNECFPNLKRGYERTIDSHIKNIRVKLEGSGVDWIETIRGYGYRFRGQGRLP